MVMMTLIQTVLELHGIALLECMFSNCNWVNQAQLKLTTLVFLLLMTYLL